jgi:hypothetical protein
MDRSPGCEDSLKLPRVGTKVIGRAPMRRQSDRRCLVEGVPVRRLPPAAAAVGLALLIVVGGPAAIGSASPAARTGSAHPSPSASATGASSMPGMDMSGTGVSMPGMDMGSAASGGASVPAISPAAPSASPAPSGSSSAASSSMPGMVMDGGAMPGMTSSQDGGTASVARPRAQVVGTFAVVNAGVMIAAAFLRRHTRDERARRASVRRASRAPA